MRNCSRSNDVFRSYGALNITRDFMRKVTEIKLVCGRHFNASRVGAFDTAIYFGNVFLTEELLRHE